MIASMTGFGRGTGQVGSTTVTVEMRSVNNRFLDVTVRLPHRLADREPEAQAAVRAAFERGKVNVHVQIEQAATADLPVHVNVEAAAAYGRLLEELRRAAGIEAPVRVEDLLRFSDVFTTEEEKPDVDDDTADAFRAALAGAIEAMQAMRLDEGVALFSDLTMRLDAIEAWLAKVEMRAPQRVAEARQRLHDRVAELLGDDRVDPDRLEQEIVFLADKLDVTEETVRLRSHLSMFREALAGDEPAGRKLNFIVQEIHREVNTIGSKANDAEVGRYAVAMKEEVEKIREQVQNVE